MFPYLHKHLKHATILDLTIIDFASLVTVYMHVHVANLYVVYNCSITHLYR